MKIRAKHRMNAGEPAGPETRREYSYKVEQHNLDGSLEYHPYIVTEEGIDVPKSVADIFMNLWGDRIEVVPDEPEPVLEEAEEVVDEVEEILEPVAVSVNKKSVFKRKRK